jgi:hypothetical protein
LLPVFTSPSKLEELPCLLAQKFPARSFIVETSIELGNATAGTEAGLAIAGRESAAVAIVRTASGYEIIFRERSGVTTLSPASGAAIQLRVQVSDGGRCEFAFADSDGKFSRAPATFQAQPGIWIGAKVGLYSVRVSGQPGSHADFDYFRFKNVAP